MLSLPIWFAHLAKYVDDAYVPQDELGSSISTTAFRAIVAGSVVLGVMTAVLLLAPKLTAKIATFFYSSLMFCVLAVSLIVALPTLYLQADSTSGSFVRQQVQVEFWACGNEMELRDPASWLFRHIGVPNLYESDDRIVHINGIVDDELQDASLGAFIYAVGGALSQSRLLLPLNTDGDYFEDNLDGDGLSASYSQLIENFIRYDRTDGRYIDLTSGLACGEDYAQLQVFVYELETDGTYRQVKLDKPSQYILSEEATENSDKCVIFDYDKPKSKTDKLCPNLGERDMVRCLDFGVHDPESDGCDIWQRDYQYGNKYYLGGSDA